MRKRYEMTDEDLDELLEASKPVPYLIIGGVCPRSPQENANAAWKTLGDKLHFDYMTVQPTGEGLRFFTAESTADE